MGNLNPLKISYVPLDELTTPREGYVLMDRWWVVDRERGAMFYGFSPQCNHNRALCEHLCGKLYENAEVVFVPVAFIGSRGGDRY